MPSTTLDIPLLRAACWFAEEPPVPLAGDGFLELAWGRPDVAFVEPLLRRRLSPLAKAFCHCAQRVAPPGGCRVVFASRHGEAERTLAILQDLAVGEEVSPTQFSMSVHNAVPGLWSILKGDRSPACAVAAGAESFGWGLVEALAAFRAEPERPLLFVYGDDRLPEPWAGPVPPGLLHAVALLLGEPAQLRLVQTRRLAPELAEPDLPQSVRCLQALAGGGPAAWEGPGGSWSWSS